VKRVLYFLVFKIILGNLYFCFTEEEQFRVEESLFGMLILK
jgi:hypothetical protein